MADSLLNSEEEPEPIQAAGVQAITPYNCVNSEKSAKKLPALIFCILCFCVGGGTEILPFFVWGALGQIEKQRISSLEHPTLVLGEVGRGFPRALGGLAGHDPRFSPALGRGSHRMEGFTKRGAGMLRIQEVGCAFWKSLWDNTGWTLKTVSFWGGNTEELPNNTRGSSGTAELLCFLR